MEPIRKPAAAAHSASVWRMVLKYSRWASRRRRARRSRTSCWAEARAPRELEGSERCRMVSARTKLAAAAKYSSAIRSSAAAGAVVGQRVPRLPLGLGEALEAEEGLGAPGEGLHPLVGAEIAPGEEPSETSTAFSQRSIPIKQGAHLKAGVAGVPGLGQALDEVLVVADRARVLPHALETEAGVVEGGAEVAAARELAAELVVEGDRVRAAAAALEASPPREQIAGVVGPEAELPVLPCRARRSAAPRGGRGRALVPSREVAAPQPPRASAGERAQEGRGQQDTGAGARREGPLRGSTNRGSDRVVAHGSRDSRCAGRFRGSRS